MNVNMIFFAVVLDQFCTKQYFMEESRVCGPVLWR